MKNKATFEEMLQTLEDEVKKLESGNMTVDESLAAYERAIGLVKECNVRLENAESRVRILTQGSDGVISDAPFDNSDYET